MSDYSPVLDVCCGSRMFWFDKNDDRSIFLDKRKEQHVIKYGDRTWSVDVSPDIRGDFTNLPFPDNSFNHVVFDPPHLTHGGKSSWIVKKYGKLEGDWKDEIKQGFAECFRVLKPGHVLVFKWSEIDVKVSEILALTNQSPLYGHRSGKQSKTHWIVFIKEANDG